MHSRAWVKYPLLPRTALAVCPGVPGRLNDRQRAAGGHWAGRARPGYVEGRALWQAAAAHEAQLTVSGLAVFKRQRRVLAGDTIGWARYLLLVAALSRCLALRYAAVVVLHKEPVGECAWISSASG
jgi:hypothetical protein